MWGIVYRYLPRGSWRMQELIYSDKERAEAKRDALNKAFKGSRDEQEARVVYLGDREDWK